MFCLQGTDFYLDTCYWHKHVHWDSPYWTGNQWDRYQRHKLEQMDIGSGLHKAVCTCFAHIVLHMYSPQHYDMQLQYKNCFQKSEISNWLLTHTNPSKLFNFHTDSSIFFDKTMVELTNWRILSGTFFHILFETFITYPCTVHCDR